jgi:hypothetical protein
MDVKTMLMTAAVLLAITGAGGVAIAAIRFSGRPFPPSWLAMTHGLLASAGLTLLLFAAFTYGLPGWSGLGLVFLLVGAAGGLVLNLAYHWRERPLPISLVVVHAAIAVTGLVLIALAAW